MSSVHLTEDARRRYRQATLHLDELGDHVLHSSYLSALSAETLCERYPPVRAVSDIVAMLLWEKHRREAANTFAVWLDDPGNWPLFNAALLVVVKRLQEKLHTRAYPELLHDFHDLLDFTPEAQLAKAWHHQRYNPSWPQTLGRTSLESTFVSEEATTKVTLLDVIEEGDYTRHGRWRVDIFVLEWRYEDSYACERVRHHTEHDDPRLKFTVLSGPRAGQQYFWTPGGKGTWDRERLGAIAYVSSDVCRYIFGMDEVSQDVDLDGKRR